MGLNKKSLDISKSNLGLGNVANLSPAEIAAILKGTKFNNVPSNLNEDELAEWTDFINSLNLASNLTQEGQQSWNEYIDERVNLSSPFPIGGIIMWSNQNIPEGFSICNGSTLTRSNGYGKLCDLIGPNAQSYTLPDLRDRFIVGAGNSYNLGNTGGSAEVTLTKTQSGLPDHTLFSESTKTKLDPKFSHWHTYIGDDHIQAGADGTNYSQLQTADFKNFIASLFEVRSPLGADMQGDIPQAGAMDWGQDTMRLGGYYKSFNLGNHNYTWTKVRYNNPSGEIGNSQGSGCTTFHGRGDALSHQYEGDSVGLGTSRIPAAAWGSNLYDSQHTDTLYSGFYRTDGCSQHDHELNPYSVTGSNAAESHENRPPYYSLYYIMRVK